MGLEPITPSTNAQKITDDSVHGAVGMRLQLLIMIPTEGGCPHESLPHRNSTYRRWTGSSDWSVYNRRNCPECFRAPHQITSSFERSHKRHGIYTINPGEKRIYWGLPNNCIHLVQRFCVLFQLCQAEDFSGFLLTGAKNKSVLMEVIIPALPVESVPQHKPVASALMSSSFV